MAYESYLGGMGANALSSRLNAAGVPTYTGVEWSPSRVRSMLRNPTYKGMVQWYQKETVKKIIDGVPQKQRDATSRYILVPGLHQAIISAETWDAVNAIFTGRGKRPLNEYSELKNPLAGILRCGLCGRSIRMTQGRGASGKVYHCPNRSCPTKGISADKVISAVLSALESWVQRYPLDDPSADAKRASEADMRQASQDAIKNRITQLEAQLEKIRDLLEREVYTVEEYTARKGHVSEQLGEAKKELQRLNEIPPDRVEIVRRAIPHIARVIDAYSPDGPANANNALLRSVLDHIDYYKTQGGNKWDDPARYLELTIHPLIF
jgi:hypothetical protein